MCGITGWIDFTSRDFNRTQIMDAMTDAHAHRGPDARGTWHSRHASLGHRRLSIIDLKGGAQPMITTAQSGHYVAISYNGEIYNFRELRAELRKIGYQFETDSDTEVLLKGYLHWGQQVAHYLTGIFAVAIWDGEREQLLLLRDHLGVKPLYYYPTDDGMVFASEPKSLFKNPFVKPRVSKTGFCEIFDMVKTPKVTPYDGMYELRPGTMLLFNRSGIRTKTYWNLEAKTHLDDYATTIETVRSILSNNVRQQLVSDVPICALLSGGLDSSAITALAAKEMGGKKLSSYSVDFKYNLDEFTADGVRGSADAPFARELATHSGTLHTELLLNSEEMLNPYTRNNVLRAVDSPPAYWGDMWPSLYLLFREISSHSKVALSGEGADEVFGGYQWFRNPAAVKSDTFPWLTAGSSRYFGGTQLFSQEFLSTLDRENYRAERYCEAINEAPVLKDESDVNARMRIISYLAITRFLQTLLDRNDRMSMANGVEVRVPFCDHRLIEYVFNIPWDMKTIDGREKTLLREAVRHFIPESVANRIKTPYPAIQDGRYEEGLRVELSEVLVDKNSPVVDLLDKKKVNNFLARSSTKVSQPYNRGSLEMALWVNRWIKQYRIEISL